MQIENNTFKINIHTQDYSNDEILLNKDMFEDYMNISAPQGPSPMGITNDDQYAIVEILYNIQSDKPNVCDSIVLFVKQC